MQLQLKIVDLLKQHHNTDQRMLLSLINIKQYQKRITQLLLDNELTRQIRQELDQHNKLGHNDKASRQDHINEARLADRTVNRREAVALADLAQVQVEAEDADNEKVYCN